MKESKYTMIIKQEGEAYVYNLLSGVTKAKHISKETLCNEGAAVIERAKAQINISGEKDEAKEILRKYCDEILNNRLELTIMPTEKCNFRCAYCYENYEKDVITTKNKQALLKAIQRLLKSYTSLHIGWFGGEPLLVYEDILELSEAIIKICDAQKKKYTASMTTNGYLLTRERYIKLQEVHIYYYQITIDGLKKQHDKQRCLANGQGTFDVIINNLQEIKKVRFNNHIVPRIMIRMNFTKNMLEMVNDILDYFGKEFSISNNFSFLFRTVGDYGGEKINSIRSDLLQKNFLADIYKAAFESKYLFNIETQAFMLDKGYCYASKKNSFVIGSDLSIYKCTVHFNESLIGHISDDGVVNIDEDKNETWYITPLNNVLDRCKDCGQLPRCLSSACPYKMMTFDKDVCEECSLLYDENLIFWTLKCLSKLGKIEEIN